MKRAALLLLAAASVPVVALAAPGSSTRLITLCRSGTPEHAAAARELGALSDRIAKLGDEPQDLASANEALKSLLASPCFAMSAENPRAASATSGLALRTWWKDGGEDWLRAYLDPPTTGGEEKAQLIVLPPDMRAEPGLGKSAARLKPVLCPPGDALCEAETRGWWKRAMDEFAQHPVRYDSPDCGTNWEQRCRRSADGREYRSWRECIEAARELSLALPLGRFGSPDRGWFLLERWHGHVSWCSELRAYHLATGRLIGVQRCRELQKHGTTRDREEVLAGHVPVENLREAVWMILLVPDVEWVQLRSQHVLLPPGLRVAWRAKPQISGIGCVGVTGSDWRDRLVWRWLDDDGAELSRGELDMSHHEPEEEHAANLLEIAEAAFQEKRLDGALPSWLPKAAAASAQDTSPVTPEQRQAFLDAVLSRTGARQGP